MLSFANDECKFEDTHYIEGTYKIRTYTRKEYHYPDQSLSYTDADARYLYECIIKNDSLTINCIYIANGLHEIVNETRSYIGHLYKDSTLNMSSTFPYLTETSNIYHMKFERIDRNIILYGDRNMKGVMNDTYDEIDFDDIGTLYLQK